MNGMNNDPHPLPRKVMWVLSTLLVVCAAALVMAFVWPGTHDEVPSAGNAEPVGERPSTEANVPIETTYQGDGDVAPASTSSSRAHKKKGQDRLIELPATTRGEMVVRHVAYTLSYNTEHNNPNWVAWQLTAARTQGTGQRSRDFLPDEMIDERHRVTTDDYRGSGYDRGHMCPAADNKWDAHAMTECFYMSNMCPQLHELNAGAWEKLESACRRWAKREGCLYIVCGPVYESDVQKRRGQAPTRRVLTIGKQHRVTVPTGFFKCVLSLREGAERAIGFYFANNDKKQSLANVCVPVDSIEQLTGLDFYVGLSKRLERKVEATCSLKDWN